MQMQMAKAESPVADDDDGVCQMEDNAAAANHDEVNNNDKDTGCADSMPDEPEMS
jgi:hypothetical protein